MKEFEECSLRELHEFVNSQKRRAGKLGLLLREAAREEIERRMVGSKFKLYVWEGVLTDHTAGMAVALGRSGEEAISAAIPAGHVDSIEELRRAKPEVFHLDDITQAQGWVVYGGG